ncbi:MAG: hypothetical protein FWC41_10050 [Firmicutes bacterium]|nr:hypothetical protein [Bacillota bacterium]
MDNIKRLLELPESKYQIIFGIQKFTKENSTVSIAIIDVTEQETERPKHKQKVSTIKHCFI